ncbi:LysM peptidoglycan-binding domain-containing protein [Gordonia sihwensis]|uniref:LysM peptidoglycan-binding domain-containing protein n=1 Tax=Gordonia TaxID=2053 RepID=UPI002416AB49|nr:LysM peptidoglycan-binding domain-containing protein [Gordonia sihwensis]WFN94494.1 LysM peptidoglycan-binding domain-containing protein [Gordonia sihwensis]
MSTRTAPAPTGRATAVRSTAAHSTAAHSTAAHSTASAMTCDIPLVRGSLVRDRGVRGAGRGDSSGTCFPTGRPERRRPVADRRVMFDAPPAGRTALSPAVYRRRRWAGAAVVGGTLAGMVWLLALVGAGYQDAATPESPAATHVVYVRSGESLTALAERIAPELPSAGVIAQLRDLNGLETSGLHVGQALIAPQYG